MRQSTKLKKLEQDRSGRFSREAAAGYDRKVIESTNAVLVGAGALGQFIALLLALIGYPKVTIVDMDQFEKSNITRSPFYSEGSKAKATATGARQLCTAVDDVVFHYATCMVQWLGDAIFEGTGQTIVFAVVDSQLARLWLAQRCRVMGVPLFEGGFHGERWNFSGFPNAHHNEPCWACDQDNLEIRRVFSCDTYARMAIKDGLIPATAPGAMGLAASQVGVANAFLHGDFSLVNCTVFTDLRAGSTQVMKRSTNPNCILDHRVVDTDFIRLNCGPDATVADLLKEVADLAPDAVIKLPASFIRAAPCAGCHLPALVELPEWAIDGPPMCVVCGGGFARCDLIPEQHSFLSGPTSEAIAGTPLEKLGLGPALRLQVEGQRGQLAVALSGDLSKLLAVV